MFYIPFFCFHGNSQNPREQIGQLNCVEQLLTIIQDYDNVSKK